MVATAADRFVVLVSSDKLVDHVGPPIPLEILAFAPATTLRLIGAARLREPAVPTPDGGLIADYLDPFDDPRELTARLSSTAGVVSHGLFSPDGVSAVLVAREDHVVRRELQGA